MSFAPIEFRKYVYGLLTGNASLMALINGIYDNVPDDAAEPYITMALMEFEDRGNTWREGYTVTMQISTWAPSDESRLQTLNIQDEIDSTLHRVETTFDNECFPGWKVLSFHRTFHSIELDPDGVTYQGIQRFEVLLAENKTA